LGNAIDKIIIHHAATTDFDGIGATFRNADRGTSAHYGVGRNNNVDQYVSEDDIAYHAGNWAVNQTSIGIENVNLTGAPDWHVAQETFDTLVELVRDTATRHDLLPLIPGRNLFSHAQVSLLGTACPWELKGRIQELADAVNNGKSTPAPTTTPVPASSGPDQILEVGSTVRFDRAFRVDNMAVIGGIWQVQTRELCPIGFTWDENGIPVEPLIEVAGGAGNGSDQVLQIGAKYTIPGHYKVLNLGQYQGRWLAQINMGGWRLWVDVEPLTEV
jgi:hypothetical protein